MITDNVVRENVILTEYSKGLFNPCDLARRRRGRMTQTKFSLRDYLASSKTTRTGMKNVRICHKTSSLKLYGLIDRDLRL